VWKQKGYYLGMSITNQTASDVLPFTATEVAYRVQNMKGTAQWKRKTFTKEAAFTKFIAKLQEQGADIETRPAV